MILPDYQGIGLGTNFLNIVAKHYADIGYDFSIVTSAKNMISSLVKSKNWIMTRYSTSRNSTNKNAVDYKRKSMRTNYKTASFMKSMRTNCKTASFMYQNYIKQT